MSDSIWTQSNQGDTTTFWSCGICGASVQTQDRETHQKWHRELLGDGSQPYRRPNRDDEYHPF